MAHRTRGKSGKAKGTYRIDKVFPGFGRLVRGSGVTDKKQYDKMLDMFDDLYRERQDVLRAIFDKQVPLSLVFGQYRTARNNVHAIPAIEDAAPIYGQMEEWLKKSPVAVTTKENREYGFRSFFRHVKKSVTLTQLPEALRHYRDVMEKEGHCFMFNRVRTGLILAFVRDRFGRRHPVYLALQDVLPFRKARRAVGNPVPPSELAGLLKGLSQTDLMCAWSMALTGMGNREYFESDGASWERGDHIYIRGTKTKARERE